MSYLFYIDPRANILLRPDTIHLCPELSALSEEEVVFIIKAFDHFSPYRRYAETDRIRRSMLDVFKDNNPKLLKAIESGDPHHRINVAIRAYKSLQYDPRIDLMNKYAETMDSEQKSIRPGLGSKELAEILENIETLRKHIKAIEDEITEAIIDEGKLKGDQELSHLENLQKKKELFEYVTRKKRPDKN